MRNKKILLIIIVGAILIAGGLAGYSYWKQKSIGGIINLGIFKPKPQQVLGEAQIIVYAKGKKIVLDPKSPHFKELQLACEEMWLRWEPPIAPITFISFAAPSPGSKLLLEEVMSTGYAVYLVYADTQKDSTACVKIKEEKSSEPRLICRVYFQDKRSGAIRKTPYRFSQFLIPLTGMLTHVSCQSKTCTSLFIYPGRIEDYHLGSMGKTTKSVEKIKKILREKFNIEVP